MACVKWMVCETSPQTGQEWNFCQSTREAFEAVQKLPATERNKDLFLNMKFQTAEAAIQALKNAMDAGCGDMGQAQWAFMGTELLPGKLGKTLALYNPVRWSSLSNIAGACRQLQELPVKQQPVRVTVQMKDLGAALSKAEAAVPAADSEEVAKLKKSLYEKECRIQDLELQVRGMMSTVVSRYFLQPQFEKLPPLALRVLSYWFGPEYDGKDVAPEQYHLWFGKSEASDREIRLLFGAHLDAAANGEYDSWVEEPLGCVALVILMDQFPRNIFRNTARSFSYDWKASVLTCEAIQNGLDDKLSAMERVWLYLVFTHSEDLELQKECVRLAKEKLTDMEENFKRMWTTIYEKHLQVIEQFGRFPHRNTFMHRKSTEVEEEFVNDVRFRFDLPVVLTTDPETGAKGFNFVTGGPPALQRSSSAVHEIG